MITEKPRSLEHQGSLPIFKSVAVIGAAGQTGELFTRMLFSVASVEAVIRGRQLNEAVASRVRVHTDIGQMLQTGPEAVILATPNPVDKVLEEIVKHVQRPTTLILPQNGVDVVPKAQVILAECPTQITLVRASLFTNVSRDSEGNLLYNPNKKRISLATVGEVDCDSLQKSEKMFTQAGFEVRTVHNYRAMERSKLAVNLLGSTSTVTGLTPKEAFSDAQIFALEHRGLKDRLRILESDGKVDATLWNVGRLRWAARIPTFIAVRFRRVFANMVAGERNNQLPAAARVIQEGQKAVESANFYHQEIINLGRKKSLESPLDEAISDILRRHERLDNGFSLASLDSNTKKNLLLEIFGLETKQLFVRSILPIRFVANRLFDLLTRKFEIKGKENLNGVQETLEKGQSVQVDPLHRSHADHEAVMKALRKTLPREVFRKYPIYILANTKFDKEIFSAILGYAYDHPMVQTLKEGDRDNEEAKWRAQIINSRSARIIGHLLETPCIFIVYLEGSRSRKGGLQEPAHGSSAWLLNSKFGLVIPTVIRGTEEILPPGENVPKRGRVSVEFCEAISTSALREQGAAVSRLERADRYLSRIVLRVIAGKLPEGEKGSFKTETSVS